MGSEIFKIQTRQQLSEGDLSAIRELETICNRHEGLNLKLNWDMLSNREPGVTNDFLCFTENGQLIGYLALYSFGRKEAEVSGMVHPSYRKSGVFTGLLAQAAAGCRKREIKSLLFICERKSESGMGFIKAIGAEYDHSENMMELPGDMETVKLQIPVALREACSDDLEMLVRLDELCFGQSREEAEAFYRKELLSSDSVFVSEIEGKAIGMLRLNSENADIFIYGFGILPEYRGKGYGRATLGRAVNKALERRPGRVALEVDCVNDVALSLYESCGFRSTSTYDYYRMML